MVFRGLLVHHLLIRCVWRTQSHEVPSASNNYGLSSHSWRPQRLELYLKFNLYLECYELLDTIFLALLNKSIAVFHIYHHITNVLIAFVELDERVTLYWVAAFLNSFVHAITYYCCYLNFDGSKPWRTYSFYTSKFSFCALFSAVGNVSPDGVRNR
ncbi:hypothetical protein SCLCIDRAFT_912300 [Scleroderma citrinum Foug A]|uniref:Very-long-chain 3-oxoacyl-CoA synthase n=1 Tax=Scleroderma citrinum Foug A TaxID=1036808 RepID=A0A0C2ZHZ4_9AGAM|nr:hypothetical protein SCLCIDRAFT_912300 [Scleroderma citrinum Foug A]